MREGLGPGPCIGKVFGQVSRNVKNDLQKLLPSDPLKFKYYILYWLEQTQSVKKLKVSKRKKIKKTKYSFNRKKT